MSKPSTLVIQIDGSGGETLADIDPTLVATTIQREGALLLRGFQFSYPQFRDFSGQFLRDTVANRSGVRKLVADDADIATVNIGDRALGLHFENGSNPKQPELAWFCCEEPCPRGGQTTACDGVLLYEALPPTLIEKLHGRGLRHRREIPKKLWQRVVGGSTLRELRTYIEREGLEQSLSIQGERVTQDHTVDVVGTHQYSGKPMIQANIMPLPRNPSMSVSWENGDEVPPELAMSIAEVAESITREVAWKRSDILILDNTRVFHGRRVVEKFPRRIWTRFGHRSSIFKTAVPSETRLPQR